MLPGAEPRVAGIFWGAVGSGGDKRELIERSIGDVKKWQDVERWAMQNDRMAVEGKEVGFVNEPAISFDVPRYEMGSDQPNDTDATRAFACYVLIRPACGFGGARAVF